VGRTSAGSTGPLTESGYRAAAERMRQQVADVPPGGRVRLAKRTTNVFRTRSAEPGLDVSGLDGVLTVDDQARTADVLGMTTYEHLVDATLPYGLMPLVVPQLKTITLGGAVTGLGIESSSFRNGLPHESVLEMDILTGDARLLTVDPHGEHSGLFHGFPNSYGSLGYALRLRIELEPVRPFVMLTHERHDTAGDLADRMAQVCESREIDGERAEFVDGTVFGADEQYLTVGTFVDEAPYTSDYTGQDVYYRSIQRRRRDFLTARDYLWRWDTDWFWCSRALGMQHPLVRRVVPRRYKRSDVYMRVIGFERRHGVAARVDSWRGRPPHEVVVQDVEVPIERTADFLDFFHREVGIEPVWLCPLRQRDPDQTWDLYSFDPRRTYVNIGFWSSVELAPGQRDGDVNRRIEEVVAQMGGRKSLYSTAYYDRDTFWATYNGAAYSTLKKTYDPDGRFADLYDKTVGQT
jgi:FAD/FMN-containing dehydrogenase